MIGSIICEESHLGSCGCLYPVMVQAGANCISHEDDASNHGAECPQGSNQTSQNERKRPVRLQIRIELVPESRGISQNPDTKEKNAEARDGQQEIQQGSRIPQETKRHTFISFIPS